MRGIPNRTVYHDITVYVIFILVFHTHLLSSLSYLLQTRYQVYNRLVYTSYEDVRYSAVLMCAYMYTRSGVPCYGPACCTSPCSAITGTISYDYQQKQHCVLSSAGFFALTLSSVVVVGITENWPFRR